MDFKVCWCCGKLLEERTASPEHFIAQSLGGEINYRILHQSCNNRLGKLDSELSDQLGHLAFLSGVKNIRKKKKVFKAVSSESEEVIYGSDKKIHDEIVVSNPHGKDIKLTGDNLEILKNDAIEKAKQLYPDDIDILAKLNFKQIEKRKQIIYYGNNRTEKIGYSEIGGKDFYRAMCKIAIDFAVYWGIDIKYMKNVIEFTVKDEMPNYHARFYSPEYHVPYYPQPEEISHYVALIADEKHCSIFCYIELFSVECCLIRLNKGTYSGRPFMKSYRNDLVNKAESESDNNSLGRNFERFHTLFTDSFESDYIERVSTVEIQKRYDRFQKLTLPTVDGFIGFNP